MRPHSALCALAIFLTIAAPATPTLAASAQQDQSMEQLVDHIIRLRGQVDDLDSRLQSLKKDHRSRMSSLSREQGQLAAERERQRLQVKKLEQKLEQQQSLLASAGATDESIRPVVERGIDRVRNHVGTSLPFKANERVAALEEMQIQLDSGELAPSRVANRLWSFVADEVRLAGETGLYRQSIRIDGEDKLVDVARLGMMNLYFRTEDGRTGYALEDGDDWRFAYTDGAESDRIENLMTSLQQKIRTGFFELPNPRPGMEVN